jgi:hypothetical protein
MDEHQKRLETKVDETLKAVHETRVTVALQGARLDDVAKKQNDLAADLAPVKRHVEGLNFLLKTLGVVSLLLTVALSAVKTYAWATKPPAKGSKNAQVSEVRKPVPKK